ncbi:GNAT family N-acetyltransferase [Asticcacaulis sp.]|uniref:GNAT family N-acetyltransferase n=1 Tax=Asticcacaulis sp. TaxID=1872648 RepID=UPI00391D588E
MRLIGKKVMLRAPEETDLSVLHEWANEPSIWALLGSWRFASNFESAKAWFQGLGKDPAHQRYVIVRADTRELIGTANLVDIDMKNGTAFHGMMLGPASARGKGFATDTVMTVMRYAFDELRLERLDSDIIEYNQASLKLYLERCGWKEEGRQRGWHYRQGRRWDRVIVGVTRADYQDLLHKTAYWDRT